MCPHTSTTAAAAPTSTLEAASASTLSTPTPTPGSRKERKGKTNTNNPGTTPNPEPKPPKDKKPKPAKNNPPQAPKKKVSSTPHETHLLLPAPPSALPIVDTHTHIASTYEAYVERYAGKRDEGQGRWIAQGDVGADKDKDVGAGLTVQTPSPYTFLRAMYAERHVEAVVDVWCEAPVRKEWRAFADAALALASTPQMAGADGDATASGESKWQGITEYWFVLGVHPHEARNYTPEVEADILTALAHPRNVGLGEIGLDYHYTLSPPDVQQRVFATQLRLAVQACKPITVHTREAEEDTERVLKEVVPRDWKIHVHCFTDSPEFAQRLLDWFPNLYIGITGVITYTTNTNTANVVRAMMRGASNPAPPSGTNPLLPSFSSPASPTSTLTLPSPTSPPPSPLRILLETDAPYMVPATLYGSLPGWNEGDSAERKAMARRKLPLCHTGMLPWTAEYVAGVINEVLRAGGAGAGGDGPSGTETGTVADDAADTTAVDASAAAVVDTATVPAASGGMAGDAELGLNAYASPRNSEVYLEPSSGTVGDVRLWTADDVMRVARENARAMYGV